MPIGSSRRSGNPRMRPGRRPLKAVAVNLALWLLGGGALFVGLDCRFDSLPDPDAPMSSGHGSLPEDSRLFGALWELGLLTTDSEERLVPPPTDWALRDLQRAVAAGGSPSDVAGPDWEKRREAVRAYHASANGRQLHAQVSLWNRSLFPVAVRDNGAAGSGVPVVWLATTESGGTVDTLPLAVPERHHAFAATALPGMSGWKVFGREQPSPLTLTARFTPPYPTAGLTIQILGEAVLSTLPKGWRLVEGCRASPCTELVLRAPDQLAGEVEVRLTVSPVQRDGQWNTVGALRIARRPDGAFAWLASRSTSGQKLAPTEIVTADGVPLIDGPQGKPTPQAVALGVLPVTGLGTADPRGVAGQAARRPGGGKTRKPVRVGLTIDSRVQAAAVAAIGEAMAEPFMIETTPRNGQKPTDPFLEARRAVLVALDPDTGAIVASATWPPPPVLDLWSVTASSHRNPALDPFAPIAWQVVDSERAPGSTFKLVSGMAFAAAAIYSPRLEALIRGCAPLADGSFPCLGFGTGTTSYAIPPQAAAKSVRNFYVPGRGYQRAGEGLGPAKLERAPVCADGARNGTRVLGEAQAIRDSLNVYFVRGVEMLDADEARRYDHAMRRIGPGVAYPPPPALRLADMIRTLGFEETVDIAGAARSRLGPFPAFGTTALTMSPAQADIFDLYSRPAGTPDRVHWQDIGGVDLISRTAIGQQIYPTPAQMARVAAAVRNGTLATPHLIGSWDGERLPSPPLRALPPGDREPIIAGMRMVVETGTAAGGKAFGRWDGTPAERVKCASFGKTGTSEVAVKGKHPHTTAWFVGWTEPGAIAALAGDEPPGWPRPLAFACMVTHGIGNRRTGGGVCAPIVANFLEKLAQAGGPRRTRPPHPIPEQTVPDPAASDPTAPIRQPET